MEQKNHIIGLTDKLNIKTRDNIGYARLGFGLNLKLDLYL